MSTQYDAIVVGARCGGSPTAMLLARQGHRVLVVDRATFPSDTISTHLIHPPGVAALARWGLLEALEATGCPPIHRYTFDFEGLRLGAEPHPAGETAHALCPRRIVLDDLLVRAAAAAGAEVREGFTVEEVLIDDGVVTGIRGHARGGTTVTERARVVIGADGRRSLVARAVGAQAYDEVPTLQVGYYAYWSDLPTDGVEFYAQGSHGRGWGVLPTHDGLTCVVAGWPQAEFKANRADHERHYLAAFDHAPEFAERIRAATRETRFAAASEQPGWFRRPYGPGWALVGDAGYHKDPITACGITDAFLDAEGLAAALDEVLGGTRPAGEALGGWHGDRDARVRAMYELTCAIARLEPAPPELQALLSAAAADADATRDFVSAMALTLPVPAFFGPENAQRLLQVAPPVAG